MRWLRSPAVHTTHAKPSRYALRNDAFSSNELERTLFSDVTARLKCKRQAQQQIAAQLQKHFSLQAGYSWLSTEQYLL